VMPTGGGDPTRITGADEQGIYPSWSPDGSLIAYARGVGGTRSFDLFTIEPDGSNLTRVTDLRGVDVDPSWSPDGTRLVFQRQEDVAVVDVDGSNLQRLTATHRLELAPAWSPDGSRIVYSRGANLFDLGIVTMSTEGTERVVVADRPAFWFDWPDWQPVPG
jgi:TolB protein